MGGAEDVDAERVVAALGYGAGFVVGQGHDGEEGAEDFGGEERVYGWVRRGILGMILMGR